jgi:hypothetical protein
MVTLAMKTPQEGVRTRRIIEIELTRRCFGVHQG